MFKAEGTTHVKAEMSESKLSLQNPRMSVCLEHRVQGERHERRLERLVGARARKFQPEALQEFRLILMAMENQQRISSKSPTIRS